MQQCEQKSEPVLLIIGRLQSLNTSFKVSTLGCPNIECQVAKEIELLETVFTTEASLTLFTEFGTKFEEDALKTGSETSDEMVLTNEI